MRKAVLAILLCAAPLLAAPAQASQSLIDRQALREAERVYSRGAGSGSSSIVPLPLRGAQAQTRDVVTSVASNRALGRMARHDGPARVLVGVRARSQLPGVARLLERLGAAPEAFEPIGVLAATVPSAAALARALAGDPRLAYVERDTRVPIAADPFDIADPQHGGLKYTWF